MESSAYIIGVCECLTVQCQESGVRYLTQVPGCRLVSQSGDHGTTKRKLGTCIIPADKQTYCSVKPMAGFILCQQN
ncbi:hypothetical protein DPMN_106523 [Dreissena polymorpha]|uniref:Uncharacterized protein n=1 Tax=Dreissena polymorpha TaxID=45954 RepID=A0A9D4QJV1_DREPO|nr:hypothetical protein DPMN_106523 [Dreissena polymorpha]